MNIFEQASDAVDKEYIIGDMMTCENCIEWIRGSNIATVSFTQIRYINKIKKYAKQFPNLFEIVAEKDGVLVAHIPVRSVKIQYVTPREMSEDEKELARERLAMYREQKKLDEELAKEDAELETEVNDEVFEADDSSGEGK